MRGDLSAGEVTKSTVCVTANETIAAVRENRLAHLWRRTVASGSPGALSDESLRPDRETQALGRFRGISSTRAVGTNPSEFRISTLAHRETFARRGSPD